MKRIILSIILLIFALPVSSQATLETQQVDKETHVFNQIATQWMVAYNGTDATLLEPFYTKDAQYISGHVPGLVANGRDKVISNFQIGMKMGGHIDKLIVLSITQSDTLATVLCEYHATNAGQSAVGRTLLLFRKDGRAWKIYLHMTVV